MAAMSWQLTVDPARSARNSAVQWTTGTPSARAARSTRAVFGTTPTRAAASASWGKEVRSPTTPRWISMVSTADLEGAATVARSTGTASGPGQVPEAVRAPPASDSSGAPAAMAFAQR